MFQPPVFKGRLNIILYMLRVMILVSTPAALMAWASSTLLTAAQNDGGFLVWLGFLLTAPVTGILVLLAVIVDFFLTIGIIAALFARKVKFVNVAPINFSSESQMKDVTPKNLHPDHTLPRSHDAY